MQHLTNLSAGIIIGALAGLAVLAALLFFFCRKRRRSQNYSKQDSTIGPNSMGSLPKSEEYRHLQSGSIAPSSIKSAATTQVSCRQCQCTSGGPV